jgi:hypothetical protein
MPVGAFFMVLVLALAGLGVGFGLWSKLLLINGTVNTGKVDAEFFLAFTDDDDVVDDPEKDGGLTPDNGECELFGEGSCDPKEFGPNPDRYDKDVGLCTAIKSQDGQSLTVTVTNGYPSYHCTVWFDILNSGSIPVKIQSLTLNHPGFTEEEVTVELSELACGQQIDPDELAQGDVHIHVEQGAAMNAVYTFTSDLLLVQWNEFEQAQCPAPPS